MNLDQLGVTDAPESLPQKPKASDFLHPLLHVMGERTHYQPHTFVLSMPLAERCPLKDEVLRLVGLNPDDEASLPYPLHPKSPAGLYRRIYLIRQQRGTDFSRKRCSPHLFTQGRRVTVTVNGKKVGATEWGLTERGVAAAVLLRSRYNTTQNATSVWMEGQFKAGLYENVRKRLFHNPQLSIERSFGEIEDHLHHYIAVAVRRDSFFARLAQGDAPTPNQLAEWALRKAISAFRKYSQDALHREMRGALTKRERTTGVDQKTMVPSPYQEVIQGGVEDDVEQPERVLIDSRAAEEVHHAVAFNEGMDRFRDAIRRHKPGAAERYVSVFDQMCEGTPVAQIGENEKVSRNRAASLMATARDAIRSAAQASTDARALLRYIDSKQECSLRDLEMSLLAAGKPDLDIGKLVQKLVDDRMLEYVEPDPKARNKKQRKIGCYFITQRGLRSLRLPNGKKTAETAMCRMILCYVKAEPYAMKSDIEEHLDSEEFLSLKGIQTKLEFLVEELVSARRLVESEGGYTVTNRGYGLLQEWDIHGDVTGLSHRVSL